jgi:aminoglycoside phosphotransferase (APT) family kinase protein
MEQNNLYHNDYHEENILIDTNNKIGIIDFGLADTEPSDFTKSWEYTCNKLIDIKRKGNLKSPTGVSNNFDDDYNLFGEYGGRRIRRRKTVNRRKTRRKSKSKRKTKKYKR